MAPVTLRIDSTIATLTLNPPPAGTDRALLDEVGAAAERVAQDRTIRALILHGPGDLGRAWSADAVETPDGLPGVAPLGAGVEALAGVPQPVIAAFEGAAVGPGLELALACDIRIAGAEARLGLPDTAQGTLPRAGGGQRLARAVGRAHALRLLLLGDEIDAPEALRIGLVSLVTPPGGALAEAQALAGRIAERGPIATRLGKEAVHRGAEMTLEQALRYELDLTVLLQSTADRAEGVRAFAARRPPRFTGQ